jgi:monoamine oxidase
MDRRKFLKQSAWLSIGGLLVPSAFVSACRQDTLFENAAFGGDVLIIGAGAAGLYAGYVLHSKGIRFRILEASATHGGRMGKATGFVDYTIDTGAQWLHGKNNILADAIAQSQTKITRDDSELTYWYNNQLVTSLPKDPFIFEADNLPDVSFKTYATQQGFDASYDNIVEAIAGDQGASASLLSAYWNSKDEENWVSGSEDFKFQKSYFDFIDTHFAQPILDKITYNTPVQKIDYSNAKISVTDTSGNTYEADKVIVTVPMAILKLNEITFVPALPDEQVAAFGKFGMGPGMKVFLKFSTKFYADLISGGAICGSYADDTVGKTTSDHVLLAFIMGDQAQYLTSLGTDAAITNALLQELDLMYNGQASATFQNSLVINYTNKPFIKGVYGFSTIGMGDARVVAAKPVQEKVYFAGEAMNTNGHHQTVHGAVESAYKTVIDMLTETKR